MMQPTPAPSSVPNSHGSQDETIENQTYRGPPPNSATLPFKFLVGLFETLQNERKQERRKQALKTWFNLWRQQKGYDLYPVLRLLLPQKDKERAVYGLKEKNLAKIYIKLLGLGRRDPDAIRLENWKKPSERDKLSGDFPTVLYDVVSKRSSVMEGTLTIDDLNDILDDLCKNSGKQEAQSKIMQRIYNRATPDEQRWIARIILKDMLISVKETTIFAVFHEDAQDLYNTCSDLKNVVYELWDPELRLNAEDKTVQIFHAFAPMLCKRPTKRIEDTVKEMGGYEFLIEEKLDGERMQLHKRGNEYFYCSRKGKDYTYLYGNHIGNGSLTPHITKAFNERVDSIILDGEMLVWDPISERNLAFGTLKTAALDISKREHKPRPCFKVFDILYLNGTSLLENKLESRKKLLERCIKQIPGRIELATYYKGKTDKDIRDRMEEIMSNRGEGLVIKHPKAQYVLNGRNLDWIKVKPEYMDNMGETVDVLVVAGNYGSGKRSGGVSTLVCALMDDRNTHEDDEEQKYSSFVRIGTGLTFADYIWIREKPWKPWDPKHPPSFLQTAKKGQDDKGDMYLNPEDSFILKVKAAEITPSDQYHIGYTMRFPRAVSIRDDLTLADCMTVSEILEGIKSEKKRKLHNDSSVAPKKRKVEKAKAIVLPQYSSGIKKSDVQVVSDLFAGMKFVITSDPKSRTGGEDKRSLTTQIYANGGACAQMITRPVPGLYVVYGGTTTPFDLRRIIDKGMTDIIKPSWIIDSVNRGERMPMVKKYFFHAIDTTRQGEEYNQEEDGKEPTPEIEPSKRERDTESMDYTNIEQTNSEVAEWIKIDMSHEKNPNDGDDAPLTDYDSDNADFEEIGGADVDRKELYNDEEQDNSEITKEATDSEVKMGEDDTMNYDPDRLFSNQRYYLDTLENARKNGLTVKPSKHEEDIEMNFKRIAKIITENGGKIVGLEDPKLTHVVIDRRDISRRKELWSRTSKPKHRHLVISQYIDACVQEETALDEDEYKP